MAARPWIYSERHPLEPIRLIHHREDGKWWSESPDVDGWYAAGDTLDEEGSP